MKLHIRPKMIISFLAMGIPLLALAIAAIFFSNRMLENSGKILNENVSSLKAAEELEIALLDMKGLTANYLLDSDSKWIDIFNEKKNAFDYWFSEALSRTHTEQEEQILKDIKKLFEDYIIVQKRVINLFNNNEKVSAVNLLTHKLVNDFNQIFSKCEELLSLNEKLMKETSVLIANDNKTINTLMYTLGLAGLLLGLSLGIAISKSITRPLYKIVLKMKDATESEIFQKVDISEKSEIQNLDAYAKLLIDKVNKTNKDLEQNRHLLIRSEKLAALGKMASGLAHEIRNPLTAIKMLVFSLIQESNNNPSTMADLEIILKEIKRLEVFVQNFLDFARPPNPSLVATNINEVINESKNLLAPQFKNKKTKINTHLTQDIPEIIADKDQLQQVFVNLLLNALQSIKNEGVVSILTELNGNSEPKHILITIKDNGTGIPQDIMPNIFDPFVSVKEDGTGLGLSIAHQIVSNHTGWIKAENNTGGGAKFTISIPLKGKLNE
jgi:signal transduction histidine kinase